MGETRAMQRRKKLIEVALPLEAINREAAREKSIRHGIRPRSICGGRGGHWAACRAVLFAQLVDGSVLRPRTIESVSESMKSGQAKNAPSCST